MNNMIICSLALLPIVTNLLFMKFRYPITILLLSAIFFPACQKSEPVVKDNPEVADSSRSAASIGMVGSEADTTTHTKGGIVLMGGSTDVDDAMKWMIRQSGGGDFVVIRATGTDAYNPYLFGMGDIHSVETLKINSVSLANDSSVAQTIRDAEALFIAGGDQSDYIRFWKGTKTADAINYLITEKKAPVGGTSAGCAILGEISFSALNGTITSEEALNNPYHNNLTLQDGGFINVTFLENTVTDQHYLARNRVGRHVAFMARIAEQRNGMVHGIGVDELTAVVIDSTGMAAVLGESSALFISQTKESDDPEVLQPNEPLTWKHDRKALTVFQISSSTDVSFHFDLNNWTTDSEGIDPFFYYVEAGELKLAGE